MTEQDAAEESLAVAPEPESHWKCERCGRPYPTYIGRCRCAGMNGEMNTVRMVAGPCPPPWKKKEAPGQNFAGLDGAPRGITVEDGYSGSQPIGEVEEDFEPVERLLTHVPSLDLVLGPVDHGAARGAVVLIGGEPGAGKSTMLIQASAAVAERGEISLFISGEQTKSEIVEYATRLGVLSASARRLLRVAYTTSFEEVEAEIEQHEPAMVVIDSLTLFSTMRENGRPGSIGQAIGVMRALYEVTVARSIAMFVVSQVTKDGDFASSKAVQHHAHVVARMRLVDDPIERFPLEAVAGSVGQGGEPLDFVELVCLLKNRFGKRRVPGYFVVGESGVLQSIDLPPSHGRARRRG